VPKGADVESLAWMPDNSGLLASWTTPDAGKLALWMVSILGGNPRQLSDEGWAASLSADGSRIVFLKAASYGESGAEVWLMNADGSDQKKIVFSKAGEVYGSPIWSPDGRWIAYNKWSGSFSANNSVIEVFDVNGGSTKTVISDPRIDVGLRWLPDWRLLYTVDEPSNQSDANFWFIQTDHNASTNGAPRRITTGSGIADQPTLTADARHLFFVRLRPEMDVYVADWTLDRFRLGALRRLTLDDADDLPFDWTPDSKAVLFISNRTGAPNIFEQKTDETTAQMLSLGADRKAISRLTPDGSQIIYSSPTNPNDNSAPVRLMRVPLSGGPPQLVLQAPSISNHQCPRAPANVCLFSELKSPKMVISAFDPLNGDHHEILTVDITSSLLYNWSLSPDGKFIAGAPVDAHAGLIHLFPVSGGPSREIDLQGWRGIATVDWASDSKGLFISANPTGRVSTLMFVDLSGHAHPLWSLRNYSQMWAIPSRDGRHVAIPAPTLESNVFSIEDF